MRVIVRDRLLAPVAELRTNLRSIAWSTSAPVAAELCDDSVIAETWGGPSAGGGVARLGAFDPGWFVDGWGSLGLWMVRV